MRDDWLGWTLNDNKGALSDVEDRGSQARQLLFEGHWMGVYCFAGLVIYSRRRGSEKEHPLAYSRSPCRTVKNELSFIHTL